MKCRGWLLVLSLYPLAFAAACKEPNPDTCCVSAEDCAAFGLPDLQPCPDGLTCAGHLCVAPSCSTGGCSASTPVCDTTADVCTGCTDSSECARFPGTDVCDPASGSCVACVAATDCDDDAPICDRGACRGCKLDSECPSAACSDDGACVPEASIVYLSPQGMDAGACTRATPCKGLQFAVRATDPTRIHIAMAPGTYQDNQVTINTLHTQAQSIVVHGSGATLMNPSNEGLLTVGLPTTIRNLEIISNGQAISASRSCTLERVKIRSIVGIISTAALIAKDVEIESTGGAAIELFSGANMILDRGILHGGRYGISDGNAGVTVQVSNLLVYGTSELAINLPNTVGTMSFVTVAGSGINTPTGPRSFLCSPGLAVRSSIIWDLLSTPARPPIGGGCSLVATIAGPAPVPGATSVDPVFLDPAASDYHLLPNSPARDMVDTGPTTDFEGEPRPRGARFDIGADEAP